jgi:uncharacterized protein DUF6364
MRMILKNAYLWYMKARLNLTVDEQLLVSIKKIAQKNNTSVSELVTDFFKKIAKPVKQKNIIDLVEKLEKPSFATDADLKKLYYKEQEGKYGF